MVVSWAGWSPLRWGDADRVGGTSCASYEQSITSCFPNTSSSKGLTSADTTNFVPSSGPLLVILSAWGAGPPTRDPVSHGLLLWTL